MKSPSPRPKALLALTVQLAIGVLLTLAVVVLAYHGLGGILGKATRSADLRIMDVVYGWRSPLLTGMMLAATNLGTAYPIAALALAMIPWRKRRKEVLAFVAIFMMGVLVHTLLKGLIHRPRPLISPLVEQSGYGFPSGHAMNAVVFYSAVAFFLFRLMKKNGLRLLVILAAAGIIILTGFSRVYLGVHYPSDVVAGYLVGAWWLAVALFTSRSAAWGDVAGTRGKNVTLPA